MEYPKEITQAISEVIAATIKGVPKTGYNNFSKYKYATEDDILNTIKPAMHAAGLFIMASTIGPARVAPTETSVGKAQVTAYVTMEYTLAHVSGAVWPEKLHSEGAASDNQDKAVAQAITHAHKYFLLKFFMLATDQDPDRDKSDNSDSKPKPKITAKIEAVGEEEFAQVCESIRASKRDGTFKKQWLDLLGTPDSPTPFQGRLSTEQMEILMGIKAEGVQGEQS